MSSLSFDTDARLAALEARFSRLEAITTKDSLSSMIRAEMIRYNALITQDNDDNNNNTTIMGTPPSQERQKKKSQLSTSSLHLSTRGIRRDRHEKKLTTDTFAFLIVSKTCNKPFALAIAVAALQCAIFTLAAIDLIDRENGGNPLGIPVNVGASVRVTQFLLLILAAISSTDLNSVFDILRDGETLSLAFDDATLLKFAFSQILRFFQGSLSLLLIFFLVVSADSVVEMLMNFAALEFVSQLDEAVFLCSSRLSG